MISAYLEYFHEDRTHLGLAKDAPRHREIENAESGTVVALPRIGGLHHRYTRDTLRHTFCSHLAMRGAPARAIQELAGHKDLGTTLRYMHLSPAALERSIALLETRGTLCLEDTNSTQDLRVTGDILETP